MFAGHRIGPFTITEQLGAGGMASVFAATCHRLDLPSEVAIKVLHPTLLHQSEVVEMFQQEARICSRIRHPNVCRVFELGRSGALPYMVLERLRGLSLRELWHRAPYRLPGWDSMDRAALVCQLLADACSGLHAAHELTDRCGESLGIVHGDVSPENLYLTWDGRLEVIDFGLAVGSRYRPEARALRGKPAYLAPELVEGKTADRRADVFACGVVAWELITGQRLFARDTQRETLGAVRRADVPVASSIAGRLPDGLDDVLRRALAQDPGDRFATARDLERALRRLAARSPITPTRSRRARLVARLRGTRPVRGTVSARPTKPNKPAEPTTQPISLSDIIEVEWLPPPPPGRVPPPLPTRRSGRDGDDGAWYSSCYS